MTAPSDPLVGTVVAGRYRVIQLLGEGGMGAVYLAEHAAIEKKVFGLLRKGFGLWRAGAGPPRRCSRA